MSSSSNLGHLKTETWEQLQDIADRFEAAWKGAKSVDEGPDLGTFLPPIGAALRSTALHELVKCDLEVRWRKGSPCLLDFYLEKFPELGTPDTVSPQLIFEEFCSRQRYGDKPAAESYQARFPGRYLDFQRQIKDQPLPTMATPVPTPSYKPGAAGQPAAKPAASANEPPSDGDFLEGFKKIRKIGSGGFGEVWEAEAPGGVPVAVKMLFRSIDDDESKRELESLEVVKVLRHPYLLSTQAFRAWKGRLYIVMELADESLRDRLKACRKAGMPGIPLAELLNYFREAADALDYLHSKKVLHRDIKPDNILSLQQHAKLADFGLARLHESDRSMNASGSGTPAYMPPEVWNGKVSPASDQYSLALTYAELRLDRRLYASKDMMQLMMDHLKGKPDLDPLPQAEQEVLLKALSKEHTQRYASCKEFVQALYVALTPIIGKTAEFSLPASGSRGPASAGGTTDADNFATRSRVNVPAGSGSATQDENFATMAKGAGGFAPAPPAEKKKTGGWKAGSDAQVAPVPVKKPVPVPTKRRSPLVLVGVMLAFVLLGAGAMALVLSANKGPTGKDNSKGTNGGVIAPDGAYLPPDCVKADDAELLTVNNKQLYSRIDYVVPETDGKMKVRFILIPWRNAGDPDTFYIMEDKVSVELYRRFAERKTDHQVVSSSLWKEKPRPGQEPWNVLPRQPVVFVPVDDAYKCAAWMHGDLPTPKQWDKAAGEFEPDKGEGPFIPDAVAKPKGLEPIAVSLPDGKAYGAPVEMAPPGKVIQDMSPLGPRYMAGNGLEFTRTVTDLAVGKDLNVPLGKADRKLATRESTLVVLRGAEFMFDQPYLYQPGSRHKSQTQQYMKAMGYTSFRVVLELPKDET